MKELRKIIKNTINISNERYSFLNRNTLNTITNRYNKIFIKFPAITDENIDIDVNKFVKAGIIQKAEINNIEDKEELIQDFETNYKLPSEYISINNIQKYIKFIDKNTSNDMLKNIYVNKQGEIVAGSVYILKGINAKFEQNHILINTEIVNILKSYKGNIKLYDISTDEYKKYIYELENNIKIMVMLPKNTEQYVNFESVRPTENNTIIRVNRKNTLRTIDILKKINNKKYIMLDLKHNRILIDDEEKYYYSKIDINKNKDCDIQIGFNTKYLKMALMDKKSEFVEFKIKNNDTPILIDDDILIAPVKYKLVAAQGEEIKIKQPIEKKTKKSTLTIKKLKSIISQLKETNLSNDQKEILKQL